MSAHRLTVLLSASILMLVGCVSKSGVVKTRAAFDLSCSEDKLQVSPLSSEAMETATYGVKGCGKKASYVYTPGPGAVLNSPIETEVSGSK